MHLSNFTYDKFDANQLMKDTWSSVTSLNDNRSILYSKNGTEKDEALDEIRRINEGVNIMTRRPSNSVLKTVNHQRQNELENL